MRVSIEEGCGAYKNGSTARWTQSMRRREGESDSTHERSLAQTRVFARTRESRRGQGWKGRRREGRCGGARIYKAAMGDTERSSRILEGYEHRPLHHSRKGLPEVMMRCNSQSRCQCRASPNMPIHLGRGTEMKPRRRLRRQTRS